MAILQALTRKVTLDQGEAEEGDRKRECSSGSSNSSESNDGRVDIARIAADPRTNGKQYTQQ